MTPEELKKQIAEIELEAKKQIEELCKKATEEAEKLSGVWVPKYGEAVWSWDCCDNDSLYDAYHNEDYLWNCYEAGELFPTKEACDEAHKAKVIRAMWMRLAAESGEEDKLWDGRSEHWYIYYDVGASKIRYEINRGFVSESIYFASIEAIKAAVAEIGEENVKKYILGVKG